MKNLTMLFGAARFVMLVAVLVGAMQLQAGSASITEVGAWPNFYHSVDSVTAYPGYIRINGWMFDNNDKTTIQLTFGDKWVGLFYRSDVTKAYSLPSGLNTGFDVYLPLKSGTYSGDNIICHAWHGTTPYRIFYINATIDKPTATFDRQGGTGGTASTTVDYGTANPSITIPTKAGYAFEGYYTGKNGTGTKYYTCYGTSAKDWAETGGKTLYANWIDPNAVTNWEQLKAALNAGYDAKLASNMRVTSTAVGAAGKTQTIDLNGCTVLLDNASSRAFLLDDCNITLKGEGVFDGNGVTCTYAGQLAYLGNTSEATLTIEDGVTIRNMNVGGNNGGAVYVKNGTFTMNGGTISSCKSVANGGAVNVESSGTFIMKGGMISGNTVSGSVPGRGCGAGIRNAGKTIIYDGLIKGNEASRYAGAIFNSGGTLEIYGGTLSGNKAADDCGAAIDSDASGKVAFYGGVVTDNVGSNFLIEDANCMTVNGGVFDADPKTVSNTSLGTGCVSEHVGSKYVVGKSVAKDANNKLTAGTYTFCPTNAEYVAAGVALAPGRFTEKTGDLAWQILTGTPAGDNTWAYIEDGVCTVYGTGATSNDKPLDAQWASIKDVRISDGVTGLGTYFFYKFHNLTNVTIAASCTSLGEGALFRCLSLEQVTFEGDTLPTLGENALPVRAAIRMEGDTPIVMMVPKVTVGGKEPTLKGSNDLSSWENVAAGNVGDYHFFKYVIGD